MSSCHLIMRVSSLVAQGSAMMRYRATRWRYLSRTMNERRFNDEEVAAIFARATEARAPDRRQPAHSSGEGMTLAQLEEIGREVGIEPDALRHAAMTLGREGQATTRRFLGLPVGVGRSVDLGRALSDAEWERLVVDLRDTFD